MGKKVAGKAKPVEDQDTKTYAGNGNGDAGKSHI